MDWTTIILIGSILWVGYRIEKLHDFFIEWRADLDEHFGFNSENLTD